jgi:hypothetical protein
MVSQFKTKFPLHSVFCLQTVTQNCGTTGVSENLGLIVLVQNSYLILIKRFAMTEYVNIQSNGELLLRGKSAHCS